MLPYLEIPNSLFTLSSHELVNYGEVDGTKVEQTVEVLTEALQAVRFRYHRGTSADHKAKDYLGWCLRIFCCQFSDLKRMFRCLASPYETVAFTYHRVF